MRSDITYACEHNLANELTSRIFQNSRTSSFVYLFEGLSHYID